MHKITLISALSLGLFACSDGNEMTQKAAMNTDFNQAQPAQITTYADGAPVQSTCKVQRQNDLFTFETPFSIGLPITEGMAARDVIVTCEYNGQVKTAILKSLPASTQNAVLTDTETGNALIASQVQNGSSSSGIDGIGDILALGLSTNAAATAYYSYPRSVRISF